jgi:hypothetical protein
LCGFGGVASAREIPRLKRSSASASGSLSSSLGGSAMTPPIWAIELTPEQAKKIALVSLNWAAVDNDVGRAIAAHCGLTRLAHVAELIQAVDLKKKVDIIERFRQRGEITGAAAKLCREMRSVSEAYRPDRNMLAHGLWVGAPDQPELGGIYSATKLKILPSSELDRVLDEAQYAAHVAHRLMWAVGGKDESSLPALPPRPPPRPRGQ